MRGSSLSGQEVLRQPRRRAAAPAVLGPRTDVETRVARTPPLLRERGMPCPPDAAGLGVVPGDAALSELAGAAMQQSERSTVSPCAGGSGPQGCP